MKILVTGSAGMLGSGLVPALRAAGHDVHATDIDLTDPMPWGPAGPRLGRLDVRDRSAVERAVDEVRPDLVAHLAAETDLEISERDIEHAYLTNAIGTKHVALACRARDLPIAYISTAGVFDGLKEGAAYHEYDDPNPINVYGRSKFEGERYVQWFCDRFYIVRAGWMVGGGRKDHKFVARMISQIREGKRTLHAVVDKSGTPTYVPDFGRTFAGLVASGSYGLYHMACEGDGTRYDVAAEILHVLGLSDTIELLAVGSDYFAADFPAPRPRSEIMRNLALDLQGLNQMRPWRVALREYLAVDFAELAQRELGHLVDLTGAQPARLPSQRTASMHEENTP